MKRLREIIDEERDHVYDVEARVWQIVLIMVLLFVLGFLTGQAFGQETPTETPTITPTEVPTFAPPPTNTPGPATPTMPIPTPSPGSEDDWSKWFAVYDVDHDKAGVHFIALNQRSDDPEQITIRWCHRGHQPPYVRVCEEQITLDRDTWRWLDYMVEHKMGVRWR